MGPTVPFWALDCGDHATTAVRVRKGPDGTLEVLAWWTAPVAPGADPVEAAIRAVRRRGLRDHGLHVVLPGRGATCRSSRISPEDADLPPGEMERDLYDFTPFEPQEALLRWRRLGGQGVLDYRVAAERRTELARVEQAFERAGCRFLGMSLAHASLLTAVEVLKPGPERGYVLEVRGSWSSVTAYDGAQSIRYPVPVGLHDLRRRYEELRPALPFESALDAGAGTMAGDAAAKALALAAERLGQDVRRAVDFHRAALHGTGDEALLLAGAGAERPGLRATLAALAPVPCAPPPAPGALGPLRPGPGMRPEAIAAALPLLLAPLGAALGAAGIAPRDLDFRSLPDDLPAPRDRTLYPAAAAVLLLGVLGSLILADRGRDALARGAAALDALPAPPPPGTLTAEETRRKAAELRSLVDAARSRAALRRSLSAVVEAFPRAGQAPTVLFGAEEIRLVNEGGNYRARLRLRAAGEPRKEIRQEEERLAPMTGPLERAGWRLLEMRDGGATLERLEMRKER